MERSREEYWQRRWAERGLARAERVVGREKFFALVAYPGASGFLHVGHLRGLVYADAFHRFHRMRGRQVFFPNGTHASGLPAVTFAQKVRDRDPVTVAQLRDNGIPEEEWGELEEPVAAARALGIHYLAVYRRMGLLIDESAYVTTVDDDYQAFIRWQFHRLEGHRALVQAPHYASVCPVCGPVSVDPSETDLSSGGDAEWVIFQTVPFTMDDGRILLAATLRPETVFGATNLWVHPTTPLVVWHDGPHAYLVSRSGGERLVEQHGGRLGHEVAVSELLGRTARAPLTGFNVPIFPSDLVDPQIGSGVVMSVPAHAPADWLAVEALSESERARVPRIGEVVVLPEATSLGGSEAALLAGSGPPAERAVAATGARSLADTEALDAATERLYRLEFARGRMRPDLVDGASVPEARVRVTTQLKSLPGGLELQEFSKPVLCRNGHAVVIRKVPDQWFIHYSDQDWKATTRALVGRMRFFPAEYGAELPSILDWYQDRACTRRGRWLGTPFPLDSSWVIEPIADSTFYPAYYVVRRFVAAGRLALPQLTDAFFDYVFLGLGPGEPAVARDLLEEVRAEFTYWYPLDANIGGKEHKRVHFPLFLYTHALFLPPELQPRAIFVNWWLTEKGGGKISKKKVLSKGGAVPPIGEAFERWGADALRLFNFQAASPHQDIEWDEGLVDAATGKLAEIERVVREVSVPGGEGPVELDRWLESELHRVTQRSLDAWEAFETRPAAELVFAHLPALLRRYLQRGGGPGPMMDRAIDCWLRLMNPIAPHLSEELGAARGEGLVSERAWPRAEEFEDHPSTVVAEEYLDTVEEDLRNVLKLAEARKERPSAVEFFIAAPWKRTVEGWIRDATAAGGPAPTIREVMERVTHHPELAAYRDQIPKYLGRVAPLIRGEPRGEAPPLDEVQVLRAAEGYLARRFGFQRVGVHREDEAEPHDPQRRRERSRPGKPAFYLVSPTPGRATGPGAGA
ncbi:MAG TPA: class I tRNA ligase family protein [Thermoplasmata archaeon]|nr:class I tRNA ligase family protein [Thermoplasmata archaeon]